MGYTHYWHRPESLDGERWSRFVADVKSLLNAVTEEEVGCGEGECDYSHPIVIRGSGGTGMPSLNADRVAFNGDDRGRHAHESFYLRRTVAADDRVAAGDGLYFEFCKTARKPYDLLVTSTLICLRHHFPEVVVLSDGDPGDWRYAVELAERVLGTVPRDGPWDPSGRRTVVGETR